MSVDRWTGGAPSPTDGPVAPAPAPAPCPGSRPRTSYELVARAARANDLATDTRADVMRADRPGSRTGMTSRRTSYELVPWQPARMTLPRTWADVIRADRLRSRTA